MGDDDVYDEVSNETTTSSREHWNFANPERSLSPAPSLGPGEHDRFLTDFKRRSHPVLLQGYHDDDVALGTWSIESMMDRLPDETVDLDVGDAMVTKGLTFETQTLHAYLQSLLEPPTIGEPVRYLQGYNIFEQDPSLYDEIAFPHLSSVAKREIRAGWIGPAGSVTGYHSDIGDNQLSQVVGRKLVKLVSPDQAARVYPAKKYDPNGIACSVNADDWDAALHPEFANTEALYAVLHPGDSLYIPGRWFHYVRSLGVSISVNHLGYTFRQLAGGKTLDQMRRWLHNRGLYGSECTCHMVVDGERVARR